MRQVEQLVEYLEKCDHAYYAEGNPIVSNESYDALVESLRKMDPSNAYLNKIGHKVVSGSKVGRLIPMGTLNKYNTEESVRGWVADHPGVVLVSPKYDGFACELDYVDGELVLASTRGDGLVGEDITEAARRVVPTRVPKELTKVRGEFIVPKYNHDVLKKAGYQAMRNAVPGIVKSNSDMIQYVDFIAYSFFDGTTNRSAQRSKYRHVFDVEDSARFGSVQAIVDYREDWINFRRDQYDYEIDGLVLKTDEILEDDYSFPVHQIAWKFKSNREATTLRGVKANLGISGKFTPVGIFDEVEFQGAKLTTASLGNFRRLNELNPKVGSTVEVSRRGDIIPYIEEVTYTPEDARDLVPLTVCPHCDEPVTYKEDEPYCLNPRCIKLAQLRLQQYIGNVGVKGIGGGVIAKLYGAELVVELPDIYKLDAQKIADLPGLGQSMVDKWVTLQQKELTPLQFVTSLPFVDIGAATWKKLLVKYRVKDLMLTPTPVLLNEFGEGAKMQAFVSQREYLRDTTLELLNYVKIAG